MVVFTRQIILSLHPFYFLRTLLPDIQVFCPVLFHQAAALIKTFCFLLWQRRGNSSDHSARTDYRRNAGVNYRTVLIFFILPWARKNTAAVCQNRLNQRSRGGSDTVLGTAFSRQNLPSRLYGRLLYLISVKTAEQLSFFLFQLLQETAPPCFQFIWT